MVAISRTFPSRKQTLSYGYYMQVNNWLIDRYGVLFNVNDVTGASDTGVYRTPGSFAVLLDELMELSGLDKTDHIERIVKMCNDHSAIWYVTRYSSESDYCTDVIVQFQDELDALQFKLTVS